MPDLHPSYRRVFLTFAGNCLQRDMSFRADFVIHAATRVLWFAANVTFFYLIYLNTTHINGWSRAQYLGFMATGMIINGLMEAFLMPNCLNFSELIRTGNLDFALLKPIDTQFLVSLEKVEWAGLTTTILGLLLLTYSLVELGRVPQPLSVVLFLLTVGMGVSIFYSLMLLMASTSVWMGRNQALQNLYFYVTVFARYPREIYSGGWGGVLGNVLTFVIPVLIVVNVPAQIMLKSVNVKLTLFGVFAAAGCLLATRVVFYWALKSYRSASS